MFGFAHVMYMLGRNRAFGPEWEWAERGKWGSAIFLRGPSVSSPPTARLCLCKIITKDGIRMHTILYMYIYIILFYTCIHSHVHVYYEMKEASAFPTWFGFVSRSKQLTHIIFKFMFEVWQSSWIVNCQQIYTRFPLWLPGILRISDLHQILMWLGGEARPDFNDGLVEVQVGSASKLRGLYITCVQFLRSSTKGRMIGKLRSTVVLHDSAIGSGFCSQQYGAGRLACLDATWFMWAQFVLLGLWIIVGCLTKCE